MNVLIVQSTLTTNLQNAVGNINSLKGKETAAWDLFEPGSSKIQSDALTRGGSRVLERRGHYTRMRAGKKGHAHFVLNHAHFSARDRQTMLL